MAALARPSDTARGSYVVAALARPSDSPQSSSPSAPLGPVKDVIALAHRLADGLAHRAPVLQSHGDDQVAPAKPVVVLGIVVEASLEVSAPTAVPDDHVEMFVQDLAGLAASTAVGGRRSMAQS